MTPLQVEQRTDSGSGRWLLFLVAALTMAYIGQAPPAEGTETAAVAANPVNGTSTTIQPTSTQPTSTQPTSTQPTSTQPTSTQPTGAQPTSTLPAAAVPTNAVSTAARPITVAETRTTAAEPVKEALVINGVGDFNVDPSYIPALATNGYQHALSGMDGLFLDDDLTVINLECPASLLGSPEDKQFTFQCDPAALPIIKEMGVDVANQGNNHSLDFGVDALLDSLDNLERAGIAAVGAGADARAAAEPAVFERRGWTVAVVGFGGVVPAGHWIATDTRPGMADGDTVETMVAAVTAADAMADIVVVTLHWGAELQSGPPPDDVVRAEAMIDAGADAIFGHHPHRLNALDWYRDRPIFWSLGNFVWPSLSAAGSDTAVAQVIVEPDGTVAGCLLDTTIVSHGHPQLDDPTRRSCDGFQRSG